MRRERRGSGRGSVVEDPADDASDALARISRQQLPSLAEAAYEAIVQAIIDRELTPGTRLRIEALSRALEMSNTPIREALSRVAAQRLVSQDTNRGFTVAPLLDRAAYHQLFEVRHLLETHAITHATPDPQRAERLVAMAERMPAMEHGAFYSDFRDFSHTDREFHRTLIEMAGNPFIQRAWDDLHFHLHVGRLYVGVGVIDFSDALEEHRAIARAVHAGDMERAVRAAANHIEQAERRLRRLIPGGAPDEPASTEPNGATP
jgi:DNA-binding GntR family transcriptional regulator